MAPSDPNATANIFALVLRARPQQNIASTESAVSSLTFDSMSLFLVIPRRARVMRDTYLETTPATGPAVAHEQTVRDDVSNRSKREGKESSLPRRAGVVGFLSGSRGFGEAISRQVAGSRFQPTTGTPSRLTPI
jgi:hypothetical protein